MVPSYDFEKLALIALFPEPVPSSTTVKQLPRRSPRQHEGSLEPVVKSKPEGKSKSKQNSCNDKRDADEERPSTPPRLNVGVSRGFMSLY